MLIYLLANKTPTDFIHDPFVQFIINVVIGIGALVLAIWLWRKQLRKKKISYQVISNDPIGNRVIYGRRVKNARQVVLKMQNTGNAAVKRDDYEEPIKFVFDTSGIRTEILSTEPESLRYSIGFAKIEQDEIGFSVELEKFLLNPKDAITLRFLLVGTYNKLEVIGRIAECTIGEANNLDKQLLRNRRTRIMQEILIVVIFPLLLLFLLLIHIFTFSSSSSCIELFGIPWLFC